MNNENTPYVAAETSLIELTVRGILLSIILTLVLAISNAYLALKLGILTSASIPAAMISMGILRFFKDSTILENNAVQTAASAGEAVAGGIVYTIPGLIVIGYWHHFDYFTNFLIALCGGVLGVLFSIPLRRILVNEETLRFPEGRAIAEVLKSSANNNALVDLTYGGLIGAALELFQMGFKVIASSWSHWFVIKRSLFAIGAGFSATMIGAGFLIGHDMAISIFLGAVIAWLIALPITSQFYPLILNSSPADAGMHLWNSELRYLGIGAMLFAGIWTFALLVKPLINSIYLSMRASVDRRRTLTKLPRTDQDIPAIYILMTICIMLGVLFLLFQWIFPLEELGFPMFYVPTLIFFSVAFVLIIGLLFSVITAYFSGMVGVTASPGSSVVIAGVLLASWLLLMAMKQLIGAPFSAEQLKAAEAITIIIGSVVTGIAAIANDNTQDLKVGQLVGATPWKQQAMLLLGVLVSALIIPWVMQLMFSVYGIAGVMPREGMDISQSLPAPTAVLLAAVSGAVLHGDLPWNMMGIGALIILFMIIINRLFHLKRFINLSLLGVAIGMYLPITSTFPLFVGGLIALYVHSRLRRRNLSSHEISSRLQIGMLTACGLVAGAALMDVVLALLFSVLQQGQNALSLVSADWNNMGSILGIVSIVLLALWINRRVQ